MIRLVRSMPYTFIMLGVLAGFLALAAWAASLVIA